MATAIDPDAIPGKDIDPETIEAQAALIGSAAATVRDDGSAVHTKWQGMAGVYSAPESDTLLGLMQPVSSQATAVGDNLDVVSAALTQFAAEVRPIKDALDSLRLRAEAFGRDIAGGVSVRELNPAWVNTQGYQGSWNAYGAYSSPSTGGSATGTADVPQYRNVTKEWHEVQSYVDRNNELISAVNAQQLLLWDAERTCANKIRALYGADGLRGFQSENDALGYGLTEIPEGTEMPWGAPVERTEGCGEATANFVFKDFLWEGILVGGVWGTVEGIGSLLVGYNPETGQFFQGDTWGAAWTGLGTLAAGLVIASTPPLNLMFAADDAAGLFGGGFLPDEVRDFKNTTDDAWLNTGKALIAWDKWEEDPGTALGESVFNVATILIPAGAAVTGVKTAGTAASVLSKMARVVDLFDPSAWAVNGALKLANGGFHGLGNLDELIGRVDGLEDPNIEVYTSMDSASAMNLLDDLNIDPNTVTAHIDANGNNVLEFPGGKIEMAEGTFQNAAHGVRAGDGNATATAPIREPELVTAGGVRGETGPGAVNSIVHDAPVRTENGGLRDGATDDSTTVPVGDSETIRVGDSGRSGQSGDSQPPVDNTETGSTDGEDVGSGVSTVGRELHSAEIDRLAAQGYHVAFFDGVSNNRYYSVPTPALGAPGGKFWVMPLEDGAHVGNAADAYRATGASPAATRAYTGFDLDTAGNPDVNRPIPAADRGLYAVVFTPDPSNLPLKPTIADAGGWPHYLDSPDPRAGHTAVLGHGPAAGYLLNPHIREFVIDGGDLIRPGSLIARVEDGVWTVERVF